MIDLIRLSRRPRLASGAKGVAAVGVAPRVIRQGCADAGDTLALGTIGGPTGSDDAGREP